MIDSFINVMGALTAVLVFALVIGGVWALATRKQRAEDRARHDRQRADFERMKA